MKNPTQNLKPFSEKFPGIYRGVVENNADPDKRGRLQIRIFGVHTEDPRALPTTSLPWAECATDLMQGGSTGKGTFVIPLIGTMVWVFFEAGEHMYPVYFASCSSFPTDQRYGMDPNLGFFAGSEPDTALLNEPDWNRYARDNEDIACITTRTNGLTQNVPIAGGGSWNELTIESLASYPNRNVWSLQSGMTMVMEDTSASNHGFAWHPSNSYIDCQSDGDVTAKIAKNLYHIVKAEMYQYIINNNRCTIGQGRYLYIGASDSVQIGGNVNKDVQGNYVLDVEGNIDIDGNAITMDSAGTMTLTSQGAAIFTGSSTGLVDFSSTLTLQAGGTLTINGNGGTVVINGSSAITLNGPVSMV